MIDSFGAVQKDSLEADGVHNERRMYDRNVAADTADCQPVQPRHILLEDDTQRNNSKQTTHKNSGKKCDVNLPLVAAVEV